LTPVLDWRPPTRLDLPSPAPVVSLLPGRAEGGDVTIDPEAVRDDLGVGRRLPRRFVIALAGRAVRRAIGLSSCGWSSSLSAMVTRRFELGVLGVCMAELGKLDCTGLATGRRKDDFAGVVDGGREAGAGERVDERPTVVRTGIELRDPSGVSPLRRGEGVARVGGL
jgi:hypothetical protein